MSLRALTVAAAACATVVSGCGRGEPRTDTDRLARGREIVERLSNALGAAPAFSVTTRETRVVTRASGEQRPVVVTRTTVVRRHPDRLYFSTTGDRTNEGWYDGVGLTVVSHPNKVFAQARMPETLDGAIDAISERYGVENAVADFLYSSPAKALLTATTTGGWVGRETLDGEETDRLVFKDAGVEWALWVARAGDQLPRKQTAVFTNNRRLGAIDVRFSDWNLRPEIAASRFQPRVPPDYEGIAIVQRAAVLAHIEPDQPAATGGKP